MRILENTDYDFWGARRKGFLFSGVLLAIAVVAMIYPGLVAGVDFQGGTEMVFQLEQPVDLGDARAALVPALGEGTEIKEYGSDREILVRTAVTGDADVIESQSVEALSAAFPGASPRLGRIDTVGPRFADDLKLGAIYSVIGGLIVILLYILARYDWRYGVGAVATLAHDVVVILGVFAILNAFTPLSFTITQTIIAALLTIVGYSVNDTVVVYDRIRETQALHRAEPFYKTANRAINDTLSRTIVTGISTLVVLVVLLFFGGEELRSFALALFLGIVLGTYSSVFIASPIVVMLRERFPVSRRSASLAASR